MKQRFHTAWAWTQKHRGICLLGLILLTLVLVFVLKTSQVRILCRILMYITLAGSLNIINGYSGQICLGQAGFFAIGSYTMAILLTRYPVSFWLLLPLCGILAAAAGALIALPTLRMKGIYLSMITLGFSEIVRTVALNWQSVTGGSYGIKDIPRPALFGLNIDTPQKFAVLFLVVACVFLFASHRAIHSRLGRAWMAVREGELAAASLGIQISKYKIMNFAYGAFWAGIAGGIYAPYLRYIDSSAFGVDEGFNILSMVVIGGQGTLIGPAIGAVVINLLTELLRAVSSWRYVVYACLLLVMMWKRPRGLAGESSTALMARVQLNPRSRRKRSARNE